MGKWLNRINENDNEYVLNQGDKVAIPAKTLTLSPMSPLTSRSLKKINPIEASELKAHIKRISEYYGGDDEGFLAEYINDILNAYCNDISVALMCFRDLVKQAHPANNRK